jgi:hypothetical protein
MRREGSRHQHRDAVTDHRGHLLARETRQPSPMHQPVQGGCNIGDSIHKGAIQIQQQCPPHYVALRNVN